MAATPDDGLHLALPAWLRDGPVGRWLTPPAHLPAAEARVFGMGQAAAVVAGLIHVLLVGVFLWLDLGWAALVNVGSTVWFVGTATLARRGYVQLGTALGNLEMCLHLAAFTLLFGTGAGYLLFMPAIPLAAFVHLRPEQRTLRRALVAYGLLAPPLLVVFDRLHGPLVAIADRQRDALLYLNGGAALLAVAAISWYFTRTTEHAAAVIETERRRADDLLETLLPPSIAARLKREPGALADSYDDATVLFADVVGFTPLAARLSSQEVVALLNDLFTRFDRLAVEHGVEKIKTIGDAWMAVAGLPEPRPDHAAAVARLALDMQATVAAYAQRTGRPVDLRIGIHSGPVVAGVIGERRYAYDLWGDTVNTASRMESHGLPGRIQVSAATRAALGDGFALEPRGVIAVKGKGELATWFLARPGGPG